MKLWIVTILKCNAVITGLGCEPSNLEAVKTIPSNPATAHYSSFARSEKECREIGMMISGSLHRCTSIDVQASHQPSVLLIEKVRGIIKSTRSFESWERCREEKRKIQSRQNGAKYHCVKDYPKERPNQRRVSVEEVIV